MIDIIEKAAILTAAVAFFVISAFMMTACPVQAPTPTITPPLGATKTLTPTPTLPPTQTPTLSPTKPPKPTPTNTPQPKPTATATKPRPTVTSTPFPTPEYLLIYHQVERGENLWRIAIEYFGDGQRYRDIVKWNSRKIRDPDLIYVGQVLEIWIRND